MNHGHRDRWEKMVPHPYAHSVCHLDRSACVGSLFNCVLKISSLGRKKKEKECERRERERGRASEPSKSLHCTTPAAGTAPTRPSQHEANEKRLEAVHKPHPLQGRQRLTGWESGRSRCSLGLNKIKTPCIHIWTCDLQI